MKEENEGKAIRRKSCKRHEVSAGGWAAPWSLRWAGDATGAVQVQFAQLDIA